MQQRRGWTGLAGLLCAAGLMSGCGSEPPLVTMPEHAPDTVLISNVAVLDVDSGERTAAQDVLIRGERIAAIGDHGAIEAPEDAQRIDGDGATLLPGLIDMHGHIGNSSEAPWVSSLPDPERNLQSYLYSGVTTVLDPADLHNQAFKRRDRVAAGEPPGPRIFAAGPMITAKGGHPVAVLEDMAPWWLRWYLIPRFTRQVETPQESRAAVRDIHERGADVVKLAVDRIPEQAPRIRRELLDAAVNEADALGIRTVAHIGDVQDAVDAAEAGTTLWLHGVYKEHIPDAAIEGLAAFGIPMVPTMTVFESYALLGREKREPTRLERETVDAETLAAFNEPPEGDTAGDFTDWLDMLHGQRDNARDNIRRLYAAGVTILAGADAQSGVFPGPGLHRELRLLTEAGLTPAEAIRAATSDAARYLADTPEPSFGLIAEGKRADLLLVDGDPTDDVDALSAIRAVFKGGLRLQRHPVDSAL